MTGATVTDLHILISQHDSCVYVPILLEFEAGGMVRLPTDGNTTVGGSMQSSLLSQVCK